jgi:2-iminobutanoate/2-iminopropanoate deaminase
MRRVIRTTAAPSAIGPYSQAIQAAGLVWVSGQIALDPRTGRLVAGGIEAEARQALSNLRAVLESAGCGLEQVVRATVYLVDLEDFEAVNRVYAEFFADAPPARVCVEVSGLPKGARVEIDAVAAAGSVS